jgi:hypothetical protein
LAGHVPHEAWPIDNGSGVMLTIPKDGQKLHSSIGIDFVEIEPPGFEIDELQLAYELSVPS